MARAESGAELRLLGDLQASQDGEPVRLSVGGQRVLALLAVRHRHRMASRVELAETLWPDSPAERGSAQLRSTLWRLPRPRGRSWVVLQGPTVGLASHVQVDFWFAQDAAQLLAAPDLATYDARQVRALHEDLLPRWDEEWLAVERESYRQLRLHALESCARALLGARRYPEALSVALDAIRGEPLRETAHHHVIEVHLAEGNRAEAVRHYEQYRRLLAEELGVAPSPVTQELIAALHVRSPRRGRQPRPARRVDS